jgi:hypothetical protein
MTEKMQQLQQQQPPPPTHRQRHRHRRSSSTFLLFWKIGITVVCLAGLVIRSIVTLPVIVVHGSSNDDTTVTYDDVILRMNSTTTTTTTTSRNNNSDDQLQQLSTSSNATTTMTISTAQLFPTIRVSHVEELNKTTITTISTDKVVDHDDPILRHIPDDEDLATYLRNNPLYQMLRIAMGGTLELQNQTQFVLKSLPQVWDNMQLLYYYSSSSHPHSNTSTTNAASNNNNNDVIVIGMDTCASYRAQIPYERRYAGAAGLFNTGMYHVIGVFCCCCCSTSTALGYLILFLPCMMMIMMTGWKREQTGTNAMEFHLRFNLQSPFLWQVRKYYSSSQTNKIGSDTNRSRFRTPYSFVEFWFLVNANVVSGSPWQYSLGKTSSSFGKNESCS